MECDPIRKTENVQSRRLLATLLTLLLPSRCYSCTRSAVILLLLLLSSRVILLSFSLSASPPFPSSLRIFPLRSSCCKILPNFTFLSVSRNSWRNYKCFNINWIFLFEYFGDLSFQVSYDCHFLSVEHKCWCVSCIVLFFPHISSIILRYYYYYYYIINEFIFAFLFLVLPRFYVYIGRRQKQI